MTTATEVFDAVEQLPIEEQRQLLIRLWASVERHDAKKIPPSPLGLPANFTQRLQEIFHRAKREALLAAPR